MNRPMPLAAPRGLSPHLAAACIYARAPREAAPGPLACAAGVLAELARIGRPR